jgi:hypothetical protein
MEEPEEHYPERLGDALKPIEGQRKEGGDEGGFVQGELFAVRRDPLIFACDESQRRIEELGRDLADAEPAPKARKRK